MKATASILHASRDRVVASSIIPTFLLCGIVCALCLLCALTASAQGTAFTHQGRLDAGGSPAAGTYDFQFSIFAAVSGGAAVGGPVAVPSVTVSGGLFTVRLDFGPGLFTGPGRWLEMGVRPGGGGGAYTTLSPRQELTPTPYAIFASSASTASGVAASAVGTAGLTNGAVTSAKINDGTILAADLSASLLGNTFWGLTGNANTTAGVNFLGTIDNRALDLRVNGSRAFLLQPGFLGQHSVIGGPNQADVNLQGATVAGGYNGIIHRNAHYATIGGGSGNIIQTDARGSTVSGGVLNWILTNATYATIGGGRGNTIQTNSSYGTISGGAENSLTTLISLDEFAGTDAPHYSSIGGGEFNVVHAADWASIAGGGNNVVSFGNYGMIPGGQNNRVIGHYAFAAGRRAKANHAGAFVWADSANADFASTAVDQFRVRATGGMEVVGGLNDPALHFSGSRSGGHFAPVGLAENNNALGLSSPALRVINQGGNSVDGALSVSAHGTGYIAAFGNAANWVSRLATDGTWTALAFNTTSDRNAKENFQPVDSRAVLDQVVSLPMTRWNYKAAAGVRHMGPVAQDFHAAFGVGTDDKHIATVDADGVALAAIQGLNQKVEEQRRKIAARDDRLSALENTVKQLQAVLEQVVRSGNGGDR